MTGVRIEGRTATLQIRPPANSGDAAVGLRDQRCRTACWVLDPGTVELLEALSRSNAATVEELAEDRVRRPVQDVAAELRQLEALGLVRTPRAKPKAQDASRWVKPEVVVDRIVVALELRWPPDRQEAPPSTRNHLDGWKLGPPPAEVTS